MINSNQKPSIAINFTGEYFVPGNSGERIEADHMARYRFASKYVKGKSVLDIACGVGYAAPILIEAGAKSYLGADIQKPLIDYATKIYGSDLATYEYQDITKLNVIEGYDIITCFETIEHVTEYKLTIENLFRALKPSGTLLISSPNRTITSPNSSRLQDKPDNEHHTQEFIPSELIEELRSAGFIATYDQIYGQRQRLHFTNRFARKLIKILRPDARTSPEVSRIRWNMTPRYFVICANKPATA
jgi:2-polyprenyl-3-methyl-5-hydroxy-6-metoxy-1,4-benzoquinol methylase